MKLHRHHTDVRIYREDLTSITQTDKAVIVVDYDDGAPGLGLTHVDNGSVLLTSDEARSIGQQLIAASRTEQDRISALRDAIQSIIGADPRDMAAALAGADSGIVIAVGTLREAGQ
jgi:hypothetical protein